ncbi:MAG: adenylate/guanylate cyclase domain-containing response regulator [Bacteroidota bacterium]
MPKILARVLIVDDDEAILLTLRILLRKHMEEIVTVQAPVDVERLVQEKAFDLALLDMNYSPGNTQGKEGLHWLGRIRSLSPTTRVVMMTAHGDIDLAIKAIKEGATDFVVKPWENGKLLTTLKSALRQGETALPPVTSETPHISRGTVTRAFMFLDLNDSTQIAEQLGHEQFFHFLQDFFNDLTPIVQDHQGEVYQYVGDEMVVSWPVEHGINQGQALGCFFALRTHMSQRRGFYQEKYGHVPSFKAGMHSGQVSQGIGGTTGQEVVFTGEVLNITARLEQLCKSHHVDLLVSEELANQFPNREGLLKQPLGTANLRGKQQPIGIVTFSQQETTSQQ